jgi:GNAT superfamily N-acetyltransferase
MAHTSNTAAPRLSFRRFDRTAARDQRDTILHIHNDAYVAAIESGDPFETQDAFLERFDAYTARDGFDLVIAYLGDEPAGQAWGWALRPPDGGWWPWLTTPVEPGFTEEDGKRTFALSELMVRQPFAGRHIAHALHDELLTPRQEQRATLLVEPGNTTAYRAYLKWGWRKVAELRPNWPDSPLFDVLILPLPVGPPT